MKDDTRARDRIWEGEQLLRRREAEIVEQFLVREVKTFKRLGRYHSIVLGIDAPYGRGKSWFLERLAQQLALRHPVARIDAWADDVGDEPLTAFMAAIDEALSPFLTTSKKLKNKLAAAKAAAFPVMGKLVSGVFVKALGKIAGDEIQDHLGDAIEEAARGVKAPNSEDEGAAAQAMEAAFEKIGAEIDSIVDRKGAAMLAAYKQKKASRAAFIENIAALAQSIDQNDIDKVSPLFVIIDELDRCRPSYAIKVLEEIKHFFDVPGVVFILGLHGDQLSRSVKAVYGADFDSDEYLRRFFTRRYELRRHSIVELVAAVFQEWGIEERKFGFPDPVVATGYLLSKPRMFGIILANWGVSPRETYSIMDTVRLFADGWEHPDPIEPMALLGLATRMVRGKGFSFEPLPAEEEIFMKGLTYSHDGSANYQNFSINKYLSVINGKAYAPMADISRQRETTDPATNYLLEWIKVEWRARYNRSPDFPPYQSHLTDYIPRLAELARFVDHA